MVNIAQKLLTFVTKYVVVRASNAQMVLINMQQLSDVKANMEQIAKIANLEQIAKDEKSNAEQRGKLVNQESAPASRDGANQHQLAEALASQNAIQQYKVVLAESIRPMLKIKPFNQSHVVVLVSITKKNNTHLKYFESVFNMLDRENVHRVTVVIGGTLRRHNFWDKEKYKLDMERYKKSQNDKSILQEIIPPTIDTLAERTKEAEDIENEWINNIVQLPFYKKLEAKIKKQQDPSQANTNQDVKPKFEFTLLNWKTLLDKPGYKKKIEEFRKHYANDKACQAAYNKTLNQYLETIKPNIFPEHLKEAREASIEFLLEEAPLVAYDFLDGDYLLYPEKISDAYFAAYKFFNPNDKDATKDKCRWVQAKGSRETRPAIEIPVGYSSPLQMSTKQLKDVPEAPLRGVTPPESPHRISNAENNAKKQHSPIKSARIEKSSPALILLPDSLKNKDEIKQAVETLQNAMENVSRSSKVARKLFVNYLQQEILQKKEQEVLSKKEQEILSKATEQMQTKGPD